ncbi:uncharacterized protein V1510DRAFT_413341 [Dipodascopsis tothii]|uniref:uncharacterized protein n=1 Tax=Dipodascopsis tothii TaxID=44089 RepID=UPI0034CDD122
MRAFWHGTVDAAVLGTPTLELELWADAGPAARAFPPLAGLDLVAAGTLDPAAVPLWMVAGPSATVYSRAVTTGAFFRDLLAGDAGAAGIAPRALLVRAAGPRAPLDGILLYGQTTDEGRLAVRAVALHAPQTVADALAVKRENDDGPAPPPTFLLPSADELSVFQSSVRTSEKLEALARRSLSRKPSFSAQPPSNAPSRAPSRAPSHAPSRMPSLPPTDPVVKVEDGSAQHSATMHVVQRMVMAALRLRGFARGRGADDEFKSLYHHTYRAAIFSLRHRLAADDVVPVDDIETLVGRLLDLFLPAESHAPRHEPHEPAPEYDIT